MIENYIYYIENYNSDIIDDIIDDFSDYLKKIDNLNMNFYIRLFNEERNSFQIQIQRDNKEFYIFDIELSDEYIYINQSILNSDFSNSIEEDIEIFKINNLIFEKNDNLYRYFIIDFLSEYLFELYDIDELREYWKLFFIDWLIFFRNWEKKKIFSLFLFFFKFSENSKYL